MECKYCGNQSMLEMCNDCKNKDLINNCINAIYILTESNHRIWKDDNKDLWIGYFANEWLKGRGLKFNDRKKLKRSIINKYKEVYSENN